MRLLEFRTYYGFTQEKVSAQTGLKRSTYKNYELQLRRPPISALRRIAKLYGITIDALVGDDEMEEQDSAKSLVTLRTPPDAA